MIWGVMFVENSDDFFADIESIGIKLLTTKIKDKTCFSFKKDNIIWIILRTKCRTYDEILSYFELIENSLLPCFYKVYPTDKDRDNTLIDLMWYHKVKWVRRENIYERDIKIKKEL